MSKFLCPNLLIFFPNYRQIKTFGAALVLLATAAPTPCTAEWYRNVMICSVKSLFRPSALV